MSIFGDAVGRATVNLLAAPGTLFDMQLLDLSADPAELNLLPSYVYAVMRTRVGGALTVSPKFRVGGNVTHDDVCPIFTVPLATPIGLYAQIPLAAFPLVPVNLRTSQVFVEITQSGVGPTACSGDFLLVGFKASA